MKRRQTRIAPSRSRVAAFGNPGTALLKMVATLLAIAGLALATAHCSKANPPLRIAAILPITGAAASIGMDVRDGLHMAVEEINARGGINGHRVEFMLMDSATNPETAVEAYRQLSADPPLVLLTCLSAVSTAIAPLAEKDEMLTVALAAAAPKLTDDRRWIYRYWPTAEHMVPVIGRLPLRTPIHHLTVLYLDDDYGRSVYEETVKQLGPGGIQISGCPFALAESNPIDGCASLADSDSVFIIGFDKHTIRALEQLDGIAYKGRIISSTSGTLPSVRHAPQAEGTYVVAPAIYNPNFLFSIEVQHRYEETYTKPFTQYSASGYDLMNLLAGLLEDRPMDTATLKALFKSGFAYSGLFGNVELKKGCQELHFPLLPAQIRLGEVVYR